jgi:hypothetical protein
MVEDARREARQEELATPLVVMGLSLGGIILVDYLADPRTKVDDVGALVTVGSQSPLLYTFDALESLRYPKPGNAPERLPFTPWFNIYNPMDHLSFVAAPAFGEIDGIEDHLVCPNNVTFPKSHSAYWGEGETWNVVRKALDIAASAAQDAPAKPGAVGLGESQTPP